MIGESSREVGFALQEPVEDFQFARIQPHAMQPGRPMR